MNRSHYQTRKLHLDDEGRAPGVAHLSPADRVGLVWTLTIQAWTFKDGTWHEPRLRRDAVRTLRGRR
jgi:hypothetical protein